MNLQEMTATKLVDHYNSLNPPVLLKNWKSKKSALIELIDELNPSTRTVRESALEYLCHIVSYEDRAENPSVTNVVDKNHKGARSVGLPYDQVIGYIVDEFPACKTTVACLRWYAVKVRAQEDGYEGYCLPQRRPRVKSRG